MYPQTDHESAAFMFTWQISAPATCTTPNAFSFDHYEICTLPGTDAPDTPTDTGVKCSRVNTRIASWGFNHFIHRSEKEFAARIFACDDSSCTNWIGDGVVGPSVSNDTTTGETELERWVLEDVEGFDDDDGDLDADIHNCLQNVDAIVYASGGNVHEGAFFRELGYEHEEGCFSTNEEESGSFGGIVYAEHRN